MRFVLICLVSLSMLCDWLTLRYELRNEADIHLLNALSQGRDVCMRLKGGELITQWWPRESKTADTHRITLGLSTGAITIEGSPARIGEASNVFGVADPAQCARQMIHAASVATGVILPPVTQWRATRVDLTQNYDCGEHVSEALESLRHVAGGHLRVRGLKESAIWNEGSDFWSAIAYAKGPHLIKQIKKGLVKESEEHVHLAHRLLRLEIRLRNHYLRRCAIQIADFNESEAMKHYEQMAGKLIPANGCEITSEQQLAERIVAMFGKRRARTLLGTWALIQQIGEMGARERMSRSTWFRDHKDLMSAGLGRADFAARNIITFRPRAIVARPVDSWADLKRAA